MFYKMIEKKCDEWYASAACTAAPIIDYITHTGQMRDAQIQAIRIYLYLKIACSNQPLSELFARGQFNSLELDELMISARTRRFFEEHPEAAALYEYACMRDDQEQQVSEKLAQTIAADPESIDYNAFFRKIFYNVTYSDYLFSLPMGAGKTYLMAAFIYLDLYFALNEPTNPAFAHNFIIFAPSGLKSSVVPSLRTIQKFNPAWILPEPAASEIKRMILFEVLDEVKTGSKSNKTKNPNVQKIANHQPLNELFGLVAVTNAEKVILDKLDLSNQISAVVRTEDELDHQANELRNLIGKLPALSIFIDEVHHAVDDEIKLRAVVNKWASGRTINTVIGFSGTPYLEKPEKVEVNSDLSIASAEITNIVYYYPLIDGIDNFLKRPVVIIADTADSSRIVEKGIREFLRRYENTIYEGGLCAKLAIFCGSIERLEEVIFPIAARVSAEHGLGTETILKFYRDSDSKKAKKEKKYIPPADGQMLFDSLDLPTSHIRIVLLVQMGKEGWDCRSLTGIILSQEGLCPKNMVLQTSCRCLRQVVKGASETALIYLNSSNAKKLNEELMKQQHITIKELTDPHHDRILLRRYDRTEYLKLPKVDFYQFQIRYETEIVQPANPSGGIVSSSEGEELSADLYKTTDFSMKIHKTEVDDSEKGSESATFYCWLYRIVKGSYGTLGMGDLKPYELLLKQVFDRITYGKDGERYYSSKFRTEEIEANIRKAFCDKREFKTVEELIPQAASLLNIQNFWPEISVISEEGYYPDQKTVGAIIEEDKGGSQADESLKKMLELAVETGDDFLVQTIRRKIYPHPEKDRTYHYLPYHTDSSFEQVFLHEVLTLPEIETLNLEVYFNGDGSLTEFRIKCYRQTDTQWKYIGIYTPDFLIIQRKDGEIHKAIIVETKGSLYAQDRTFKEKKAFMERDFIRQNNARFGYQRFDYLYLEDRMTEADRVGTTHTVICKFFEGE